MSIELIHTDLPEPVAPAIIPWGIFLRSSVTGFPVKPSPRTASNGDVEFINSSVPITSEMRTGLVFRFGISIPIELLPGIGA